MFLPPIRQLQYLVALYDHLHFGQAARHLNVTQSTLSTGIRELEKFLGVQLVERTNKSVTFSDLGKRIADRSRYILMQTEDLIDEAKAITTLCRRPSKLAVSTRSRPTSWAIMPSCCVSRCPAFSSIFEKAPRVF